MSAQSPSPGAVRPATPRSGGGAPRRNSDSGLFKNGTATAEEWRLKDSPQRNSGGKNPSRRTLSDKENSKTAAVRCPSTKSFMAPTISAASKAVGVGVTASSPRKKVFSERNCEDTAPPSDATLVATKQQSCHAGGGEMKATEDSESGQSRRTPLVITQRSAHAGDVDPHLPPYDPKTNYLSPRPRFLHYRPNPRIEQYTDGGGSFLFKDDEDSPEGSVSSDSSAEESKSSAATQEEDSCVAATVEESKSAELSSEDPESPVDVSGDSVVGVGETEDIVDGEARVKPKSFLKLFLVPPLLLLLLLLAAGGSIMAPASLGNSSLPMQVPAPPRPSFEALSSFFRYFAAVHPENLEFGAFPVANLSAPAAAVESFDVSFFAPISPVRQMGEYPEEEVRAVTAEQEEIEEEATPSAIAEIETDGEQLEAVLDLVEEEGSNKEQTPEQDFASDGETTLEDLTSSSAIDIDSGEPEASADAARLQIDGKHHDDDGDQTHSDEVEELDNDTDEAAATAVPHADDNELIWKAAFAAVCLVAVLAFAVMKRKKQTASSAANAPVWPAPAKKIAHESLSGSSETYLHPGPTRRCMDSTIDTATSGDTGPMDYSSSSLFNDSSTSARRRAAQRRDSGVSSSPATSYGSFTTYEKIPIKRGAREEELTPVRRSSRIRNPR